MNPPHCKAIVSKGLSFLVRAGTSDERVVREVVEKDCYQHRDFKIEAGETWIDLGGNIGAFAVLAASRGASVVSYEPDPSNADMLKTNMRKNGFDPVVYHAAVVHDDTPGVTLNLWPDGQSWRNSVVRAKRGSIPITVFAHNFFNIAMPNDCVKMDIEGSEIAILEHWPEDFRVRKLIGEYSFDVDDSVPRMLACMDRLKKVFRTVHYRPSLHKMKRWNYFPPATQFYCVL